MIGTDEEIVASRKAMGNAEKWDYRFLQMSALIGSWSKQSHTRVGCVIVDDKRRIVATGYNGFPRGVRDTTERRADRDLKLSMTLHAEENALLFAGRSVEGCTAYVTHPPCSLCTARLIQSGIKRVVYARLVSERYAERWSDSVKVAKGMALESGMVMEESDLAVQQECVE